MHGFQIILHSCCPGGGEVPFEIFFQVVEGQGHKGQIKVKMVIY